MADLTCARCGYRLASIERNGERTIMIRCRCGATTRYQDDGTDAPISAARYEDTTAMTTTDQPPLTDADLDAIEARYVDADADVSNYYRAGDIAASLDDVPALLADVRRLRALLAPLVSQSPVEWRAPNDYNRCHFCAQQYDWFAEPVEHKPDCPWRAAQTYLASITTADASPV